MDEGSHWGPEHAPGPPARRPWRARAARARLVAMLAVALGVLVGGGVVGAALLGPARGDGKDDGQEVTSETKPQPRPPAAVLAAAPAASKGAGTARLRTSMTSTDAGERGTVSTEGVIAFDRPAFDLTFGFKGTGGMSSMFGGGAAGELNERLLSDGTTVWSQLPEGLSVGPPGSKGRRARNPLAGKKYLAMPATALAGAADTGFSPGFGADALGFSIGAAPTDVLSYLNVVGHAVEEGRELVGADDTTRYAVDLDLDALQRALPSEQRSFDAYDFKPDVLHTFPAKVWIDQQGRLRKLTYSLDLSTLLTDVALKSDSYQVATCPEPDAALLEKVRAGNRRAMAELDKLFAQECPSRPPNHDELLIEGSVELSDYGTPLTITPPPAAEVITEEEYSKAMRDVFTRP